MAKSKVDWKFVFAFTLPVLAVDQCMDAVRDSARNPNPRQPILTEFADRRERDRNLSAEDMVIRWPSLTPQRVDSGVSLTSAGVVRITRSNCDFTVDFNEQSGVMQCTFPQRGQTSSVMDFNAMPEDKKQYWQRVQTRACNLAGGRTGYSAVCNGLVLRA